jgi:hypothetical protein
MKLIKIKIENKMKHFECKPNTNMPIVCTGTGSCLKSNETNNNNLRIKVIPPKQVRFVDWFRDVQNQESSIFKCTCKNV